MTLVMTRILMIFPLLTAVLGLVAPFSYADEETHEEAEEAAKDSVPVDQQDQEEHAFQIRIATLATTIAYPQALLLGLEETPGEAVETKVEKLKELYEHAKNELQLHANTAEKENWRRFATTQLITALKAAGDRDLESLSADLVAKNFNHCSDFDDCQITLFNLAEVADLTPAALLSETLQVQLESSLRSVPNDFLSGFLTYRFQSLLSLADFYHRTRINEAAFLGKEPVLAREDIAEMRSRLKHLTGTQSFFTQAKTNKDLIYLYLVLQKRKINPRATGLTRGELITAKNAAKHLDKAVVGQLQSLSQEIYDALLRTHNGNLSIDFYLDRFNEVSPLSWLQMISESVKMGDKGAQIVDPVVAFITLQRFAKFELALPYRSDWMRVTRQLVAMIDQKKYSAYNFAGLLALNEQQLAWYQQMIDDLITGREITSFQGDELGTSEQKEQWAARNFIGFHSLVYQSMHVDESLQAIRQYVVASKAATNTPAREKIEEQLQGPLNLALQKFLTVGCYGYWFPSVESSFYNNENLEALSASDLVAKTPAQVRLVSPLSDDQFYNLREVCGYWKASTQHAVIDFLSRQEMKAVWKKVSIDLAEIPMALTAASVSHVFASPAYSLSRRFFAVSSKQVVNKFISHARTAYTTRKMVYFLSRKALPHTISSAVGAGVFTLTQRAILAAFDLQPFYNSRLSPWENWGGEIAMGTAIFVFAPVLQVGLVNTVASQFGLKGSAEIFQKQALRQLTLAQEGSIVLTQVAADTAVFTSAPYFNRTVAKALAGSHEDIWQGSSELQKEFWSALRFGLAFRAPQYRTFAKIRAAERLARAKDKAKVVEPPKLYEALGLKSDATAEEIRETSRKLMAQHHPDSNIGDEAALERYKQVSTAYQILRDPGTRRAYDETLLFKPDNLGENRSVLGDLQDICHAAQKAWLKIKNSLKNAPAQDDAGIPLLPWDPAVPAANTRE